MTTPDDYARLKAFLLLRKEWFWDWRSPEEILGELSLISQTIRTDFSFQSSAFVTHREAKPLREAWVLAKCASATNISKIKLNKHEPPDGYISRGGDDAVPAEVLEVLEPNRQRNLEYAPAAPEISMDPGENWVRRADAIPAALKREVQKKKAKSYPESTELFVYLNIGEYGIRQNEVEEDIRLLLAEPLAPFNAIHVRWKEKVFNDCGATFVDGDALIDEEDDDGTLWKSIFEDVDN